MTETDAVALSDRDRGHTIGQSRHHQRAGLPGGTRGLPARITVRSPSPISKLSARSEMAGFACRLMAGLEVSTEGRSLLEPDPISLTLSSVDSGRIAVEEESERRRERPTARGVETGPGQLSQVRNTCATVRNVAAVAERITVNAEQCGGRPCVRGMRVRVSDVLDLLASGLSPDQVLQELPDLEADDIAACLRFASRRVDHPIVAA